MNLTKLAITKPIATIFIVILFVLLGIMGGINLGADLFPSVNIPVIVVSSVYPGAGSNEVEKSIVKPIEDAVAGVSGIDKFSATASEGYGQVVVLFKMNADTNSAFMDTQKAVDGILSQLPKDATKPQILKIDPGASPIMDIALSGDRPLDELYGKAELLKERIERIEGVGRVSIYGASKKELQINVDKSKMEHYGLTLSQITGRLQSDNVNFPGGLINQPEQNRIVSIKGEFEDINQIKSLRIPVKQGSVRIGDIADVTLDYPTATQTSRLNQKRAIGLSIQKQSDANIVATGDKVKAELESLKQSLKGIDLKIVDDSTIFINSSLNDTKRNLIEGVITTAIILFIFLRQWNSVFIAIVAIPTSLVSTFFMMFLNRFTFNMLSLMGLALCVGILVDDSVVVMENIHRHFKMGKDAKTAALDGRTEIGMAAIAITLSDIVVFAPIAFMSGMVGQYFRQFGLVVVFATVFSLVVSFTVTPMMSSRLFKNKKTKGRLFSGFNKYMDGLEEKLQEAYGKLLSWSLKHRWVVALVVVALLGISVSFIITGRIGTEFMPYTDEGQYTVNLKLDPGTAVGITDSKTKQVEEYVSKIPETDYIRSQVGFSSDGNGDTNQASVLVKMVEKSKRKRSQKEVVEEVRRWGKALTGVDLSVTEASMGDGGTGGGGKPININVKGTDTNVLNDISQKVSDIAKKTSGVIEVGSSFEQGKPSYDVKVDKVSAAMYGISSYDVSNTVRSGIEGVKSGTYSLGGKDYDVRVKLSGNSIKDINDLNNLYITGTTGNQIQLGQLAKVSLADSPVVIRRLDKQRVLTISANIQQGHTLGEVTGNIQKNVDKLKLPDGYSISLSGEQQNMNDTFTSLIQVLILSLLLLYIILGVLYESFLTPLVRLLALPVGIIGALSMLAITGKSLNMMSMIGIIMLDGLAAKNGTILIDFTNGLMEKGMELRDALLVAGKTRLKPILMTSFAMIVGMLPTALSFGDGSEFKSSMALVIIGGMFTSTILSPLLIPVAYTYLDDFRLALKRFFKGLTAGSASARHNEEKSWVFKEGKNEL